MISTCSVPIHGLGLGSKTVGADESARYKFMKGRKHIRLPMYDYRSNGYYFVTIVTKERKKILQDKKQDVEKDLGEMVRDIHGVTVDTHIVMPNHVHLILSLNDCEISLGEIIRRFKARVSRRSGFPLWQANYYEHVIRDEEALNRIREYIIHNPELEITKFAQFYKQSDEPLDPSASSGWGTGVSTGRRP